MRNKQQGIHQQAEANYNYSYDSRSKALGVCNKQQQQRESEELEEYEEQEKEYEEGEKTSYTSSTTTPHSRCSRGVSTEELVYDEEENKNATKVNAEGTNKNKKNKGEKVKRRDGEGSVSSRYSALLQLIACGGGSTGEAAGEYLKGPRLSDVGTKENNKALFWEEMENPILLGNLQTEEKEYFSGSLVDSIKAHREGEPVLNKSNSYNELRLVFNYLLLLFS